MLALEIENLRKQYKDTLALDGISFSVEEGDFFGLLGPNGAGKSTTIGIITSLVNKTSGKVKVFGTDIDEDFETAKRHIGIVPQEMNFGIFEKVIDIVINQGGYYGIPLPIAKKRAEKYLKQLGLWKKKDTQAKNLSGGMKRRLMIARSLVHEPGLLILDEPTAGVDVELRRGMWDFLTKLSKGGITIILTTHYLEEAENLCNNIAIIDHGSIIENAPKKKLLERLDRQSYVIDVKEKISDLPVLEGYKVELLDDTTIDVELGKDQDINHVFKHLHDNGIKIQSMRNKSNRLEEIFLSLIGDSR